MFKYIKQHTKKQTDLSGNILVSHSITQNEEHINHNKNSQNPVISF